MKNYCIFDTETTDLNKCFCYNIGYVIANELGEILMKRDFVCSEIWNNIPLFNTAYYADKRPLYEQAIKNKEATKHTFGYICKIIQSDFQLFEIEYAFAYNSSFDEKVFNYNCDWFKVANPFDNIKVLDIRGYAHNFIVNNSYKEFCDKYGYYTDSGNYSSTAETIYRFIKNNTDFVEEHTALADSEIECEILFTCVNLGATLETNYPCLRSIHKVRKKILSIRKDKEIIFDTEYSDIRINKDKTEITLK